MLMRRVAVTTAILLTLAGCASYKPAAVEEGEEAEGLPGQEIVVEEAGVRVRLHPVFEKMAARKYFGIDPAASRMLPALLVVENLADEVLKVDIEGSYLVLASGNPEAAWCSSSVQSLRELTSMRSSSESIA